MTDINTDELAGKLLAGLEKANDVDHTVNVAFEDGMMGTVILRCEPSEFRALLSERTALRKALEASRPIVAKVEREHASKSAMDVGAQIGAALGAPK